MSGQDREVFFGGPNRSSLDLSDSGLQKTLLYPVRSLMFIPKLECTAPLNGYVTPLGHFDLSIFRTRFLRVCGAVSKTNFSRDANASILHLNSSPYAHASSP